MPPEEGRRGNEEGDPALTRDDPTRRCEEDPIDDTELERARRPLQHAKLMAEDEDLEVLASVVSALLATADEETDEGADDEVEERPHRPIVPGLSERESGFPTPTGYPAGRTKGRARRADPRVSPGGVIRIVEPFRPGPFRVRGGIADPPPARRRIAESRRSAARLTVRPRRAASPAPGLSRETPTSRTGRRCSGSPTREPSVR